MKKRTIEGIHNESSKMTSAYNYRRCDSNSSTTSTVTAGNNVSIESQRMEPSLQISSKSSNGGDGRISNSDVIGVVGKHQVAEVNPGSDRRAKDGAVVA